MNEDPTEKLIKDLKEENEKLKAQLSGGKIDINEIKAMSGNENLSKEGNLFVMSFHIIRKYSFHCKIIYI